MSKRASVKGSSRSLEYRFNTWLIQHAQAFLLSLRQTFKNAVGSLLAISVIGVSLSLPAGFYLLLSNVSTITENWAGGIQISLFMDVTADLETVTVLQSELLEFDEVRQVEIINRDQAFDEYRINSGFSTALDYLEENPLPYVVLVYPKDNVIGSDSGKQFLDRLAGLGSVDSAQFDRQWANRLLAILEILQRGIFILSTLLAFAVLLIVGNTIRLGIFHRRTEIEINKLFGATDAFIRRPFLYTGLIHGLGGSIMAWCLLYTCALLLESPVSQLSGLYDASFELQVLTMRESLALLVSGAMLGLAGSWIAVKQHIRRIGLS